MYIYTLPVFVHSLCHATWVHSTPRKCKAYMCTNSIAYIAKSDLLVQTAHTSLASFLTFPIRKQSINSESVCLFIFWFTRTSMIKATMLIEAIT